MEPTSTTDSTMTKFEPITMDKAKILATDLTKFLKDNRLTVEIAGKDYVPVEGWQFLGTMHGLTQVITSCEPVAPFEDAKEIKYKATVEIINQHGTVMSRGFAWCSNKEHKKKSFDEYAIASMAQTRAIGKAYRNILSWIVRLGGYEATPAEEIDREQMEQDLTKAKQNMVNAMKEAGIEKGQEVLSYINNVLDKNTVDTIDEVDKIMESLESEDE